MFQGPLFIFNTRQEKSDFILVAIQNWQIVDHYSLGLSRIIYY